jgi:hypothetical protein
MPEVQAPDDMSLTMMKTLWIGTAAVMIAVLLGMAFR